MNNGAQKLLRFTPWGSNMWNRTNVRVKGLQLSWMVGHFSDWSCVLVANGTINDPCFWSDYFSCDFFLLHNEKSADYIFCYSFCLRYVRSNENMHRTACSQSPDLRAFPIIHWKLKHIQLRVIESWNIKLSKLQQTAFDKEMTWPLPRLQELQ